MLFLPDGSVRFFDIPADGIRVHPVVRHRAANDPFRSPEELLRVNGIGDATLERLREWIWVAPAEE